MGQALRVARMASRRALRRDATRRVGAWMLVGAIAGAALVVLDKTFGLPIAWWALLAVPPVVGGLGASLRSVAGARGALSGALELDDRLDLDGALASGVALAERRADAPFARVAIADADRVARDVDVKRAISVVYPWTWGAWPSVVGLGIVCGIFAPQLDLFGAEAQRKVVAEQVAQERLEREETARLVQSVNEEVERRLASEARPEELDALDDLERQLADGEVDPDEARREAAKRLDEAADRLEQEARDAELAREALERDLAALDSEDAPLDEGSISDALRNADFDEAERLLDEAFESADAGERERLADELDDLANRLREQSERPDEPAPSREEAREMLRELGLDEGEIDDLLDETDPADAGEQLEDEGVAPETAERVRDRLEEAQREQEAQDRADDDLRDLADSAERAAEELRDEPSEDQGDQSGDQSDQQPDQQPGERPGEQPGERSDQQPGEEPGEQPGEQPGEGPGEQPGERPGEEPGERPGEQPGERPGEQPGQRPSEIDGTEQGPDEGQRPEGDGGEGARESDPIEGARRDGQQGEQQGESQEGQGEQDGAQQQPGEGQRPDGQREGQSEGQPEGQGGDQRPDGAREGGAGEQPQDAGEQRGQEDGAGGAGAGERERMRDAIRRMRERANEDAARDRRDAETLREQARRLAEDEEDEGGGSDPWAGPDATDPDADPAGPIRPSDADPTFSDETVVAGDTDDETSDGVARTVAEWLGEGREPGDPVDEATARRVIDRAERGASRALDDRRVPRRLADKLREFYRRLPENLIEPDAPAPSSGAGGASGGGGSADGGGG